MIIIRKDKLFSMIDEDINILDKYTNTWKKEFGKNSYLGSPEILSKKEIMKLSKNSNNKIFPIGILKTNSDMYDRNNEKRVIVYLDKESGNLKKKVISGKVDPLKLREESYNLEDSIEDYDVKNFRNDLLASVNVRKSKFNNSSNKDKALKLLLEEENDIRKLK